VGIRIRPQIGADTAPARNKLPRQGSGACLPDKRACTENLGGRSTRFMGPPGLTFRGNPVGRRERGSDSCVGGLFFELVRRLHAHRPAKLSFLFRSPFDRGTSLGTRFYIVLERRDRLYGARGRQASRTPRRRTSSTHHARQRASNRDNHRQICWSTLVMVDGDLSGASTRRSWSTVYHVNRGTSAPEGWGFRGWARQGCATGGIPTSGDAMRAGGRGRRKRTFPLAPGPSMLALYTDG